MNAEKRAELGKYLMMTKGLVAPQAQDEEIAKMATLCPEATAKDKGLVDDVDKAYEVMQIQTGNQGVSPTATQAVSNVAPQSTLSSAESAQITKTIMAQSTDRFAVSEASSIERYIFDRPDPSEQIPNGTTGMIKKKSWENIMEKISSGEYTVKADDGEDIDADKRIASTTNFNQLKSAYENNQPVAVYIGELNKKPIGYEVIKGNAVGASQGVVQMDRNDMEIFLSVDAMGYIKSSDTKPGIKLKYVKSKSDPSNPAAAAAGKTVLADGNKQKAIESNSYVISKECTPEKKFQSAKSALQFRVVVKGKFKKDGTTPLTRTIRVPLDAEYYTLQRKAEFVDKFGTGERNTNSDMQETPTGQQLQKIQEASVYAIASLRQKSQDPTSMFNMGKELLDKLAAFDVQPTQAPNVQL